MRRLNVACYYPWIYLRSGIERTILEVANRSRHKWTIYTNHFSAEGTYPEFSEVNVVELSRVSVNRGYVSVALACLKLLSQKLPMNEHDVLVVQSEGLGDFVTFRNHRKPVVCFCWTPLKVINDPWARKQYVRRNPSKASFLSIFGKMFMLLDRLAWRNYVHVLTCSHEVQRRIVRARLAASRQIEILYAGADCTIMTPSYTYDKYFFAFGRIKWWKNFELAIKGFQEFQRLYPVASNFKLVVAGQVDKGSVSYFHELRELAGTSDSIEFIPDPCDEKVHSLYRSCYAVLNMTLNEDWGIVPIEANAYGKPVIAVDEGGPRESQVDGETGYLVSPEPKDFAHAIARLAQDERLVEAMGRNARQNALKYDWSYFVNRIDTVLEKIIGEHHP